MFTLATIVKMNSLRALHSSRQRAKTLNRRRAGHPKDAEKGRNGYQKEIDEIWNR